MRLPLRVLPVVLFLSIFINGVFINNAQAHDLDDTLKTLNDMRAHPEPQFDMAKITSWKMLGTRWAAALDSQGHMLGIYDLSYPDFFKRFHLGNIGAKKVTKTMIIKAIIASKSDPNTDLEKADEAINHLNETHGGPIEDGSMPDKWWLQVPWKKGLLITAPPAAFRLSDIDLTKFKNSKKIQSTLQAVQENMADVEDAGFNSDLLDQFEFVKEADGSYSFYWDHSRFAPKGVTQPRKVADLSNAKWAFTQAMKIELIETALEEVMTLVPVPAVQGLIEAALDRFFHFYDLVLHTNANMILEMLDSVQDGMGIFSSAPVMGADNTVATESLVYAQTSLLTSFEWIWTNPLADWQKGLKDQTQYAAQSIKWLQDHSMTPNLLNIRFAFNGSEDAKTKTLLLMARRSPNKKTGPTIAIDYANPEKIKKDRVGLEIASSAVIFATNFISFPGASTIIRKVYKYFVENPTDINKAWEGRLTTHLEERNGELGESYPTELGILDAQRTNPLFDSRDAMNEVIKERRALLGIP